MGVREAIARSAGRRAHVLLVEVPGHWRTRTEVERAVLARGWSMALSPADADLIAVCGDPRPRLGEAIEAVWHQMPGPRVRVEVTDHTQVEAALDDAGASLLDVDHHRRDAHTRPGAADLVSDGEGEDHGSMDHGSMDHGDMQMAPSGIALAEGGQDRDGLEMDVLHLRLGPVLQYWPPGLLLRCALQGDVVTGARAELLDADTGQDDVEPAAGAARTLDNVVSLLALAGWAEGAAEARRARDAMLEDPAAAASRLLRLQRRVRRSRVLRWSLRGLRPLGPEDLGPHDLGARLGGDTYDRLLGMLERAGDHDVRAVPPLDVDLLPRLVTGLDLAAARLVVASLDVHLLAKRHVHDETPRA